MNEFGLNGSNNDEEATIHVENNLPKEYDTILNGLENYLTLSNDNMQTIKVIREK